MESLSRQNDRKRNSLLVLRITDDICHHCTNSKNNPKKMKGLKMETDYIETEIPSEDFRLRKWTNSDGTVWYTDSNLILMGENIEEAIENFLFS